MTLSVGGSAFKPPSNLQGFSYAETTQEDYKQTSVYHLGGRKSCNTK